MDSLAGKRGSSFVKPLNKVVLLIMATSVAVVAAASFLTTSRRAAQDRERRRHAKLQLQAILEGLQTSDTIRGRLPHAIERDGAGDPIHSWRFLACRDTFGDTVQCGYYGQDARAAYSEPWNSDGNRRYYDGPHRGYPGGPSSFIDPTRPGDKTRFVAITGPGTAFQTSKSLRLTDLPAELIMVVEVRKSDCHWMQPGGDLHIETMPKRIDVENGQGISGHEVDGFFVGFASGEAWLITNKVPYQVLAKFFTIASAQSHSRDALLAKYRLL